MIKVNSTIEAFEICKAMTGGVYSLDKESSQRAGYKIYRDENEYYNYICDLGDRYELNMAGGKSINIFVECEPESETPEQPAAMVEYQLTVGLFDKETESQEISTTAAQRIISDILINRFDIFAFTMIECSGVYKMSSTGAIVREPSLRIEIASEDIDETITAAIAEIKRELNQESVMLKKSIENITFE